LDGSSRLFRGDGKRSARRLCTACRLATSLRSRLGYGFVPRVSKSVRCGLWWQWIAALALGLATSLHPSAARALELRWSAPPECSSSAAQKARIEQLLAHAGLLDMALVVHGTVTRDHKRYRLSLRIATPSHEAVRAVALADCAAVDQATVALITMAVDPARGARSTAAAEPSKKGVPDTNGGRAAGRATAASTTSQARRPAAGKRAEPRAGESVAAHAALEPPAAEPPPVRAEPEPSADVPAPVEASAVAVSAPDPPRPAQEEAARAAATVAEVAATTRPRAEPPPGPTPQPLVAAEAGAEPTSSRRLAGGRRWGRAGVLVGVWSGRLPAPQLDSGVRVGLARGALYGELRADWMLARSDEVSWDSQSEVRIRSLALGVAGCAAAGAWGDRVRVGPCVRLSLLRSTGSVTQITSPHKEGAFWLASTLSALLGVRLWGLLELSLEAGAGLPLTARPQFSVAGRGDAKVAKVVSLHAVLGLGVRWEQKHPDPSRNVSASPIGR